MVMIFHPHHKSPTEFLCFYYPLPKDLRNDLILISEVNPCDLVIMYQEKVVVDLKKISECLEVGWGQMREGGYGLQLITVEGQSTLVSILQRVQTQQVLFLPTLKPNLQVSMNRPLYPLTIDLYSSFIFLSICLELYQLFIDGVDVCEFDRKGSLFFFKINFSQHCQVVILAILLLLFGDGFSFLNHQLFGDFFPQGFKRFQKLSKGRLKMIDVIEELVIESGDLVMFLFGVQSQLLEQFLTDQMCLFVLFTYGLFYFASGFLVEAIDHLHYLLPLLLQFDLSLAFG